MHAADAPLFQLRSSPIQGKGAFAVTRIPRGTRIIEYIGEKISNREADRRYDDETMRRHHTFLFTLNDRYVVDAAVGGNEARFINHSCAPNCEAVIERGHIYIEALQDISPGTELAYDYAYERADDYTEDDEQLYVCRCGAPECRGTILAPPRKPRRPSAKKPRTSGTKQSKRTRKPQRTKQSKRTKESKGRKAQLKRSATKSRTGGASGRRSATSKNSKPSKRRVTR